ncbi:MAG: stalk domain-containing protein [Tissierellia bacterium]|nr:stalk domain-containing protein [Tissierellia bacterium]
MKDRKIIIGLLVFALLFPLLGALPQEVKAAGEPFTGTWNLNRNWGRIIYIHQIGDKVYSTYYHDDEATKIKGTFVGTVRGNKIYADWCQNNQGNSDGRVIFRLQPDNQLHAWWTTNSTDPVVEEKPYNYGKKLSNTFRADKMRYVQGTDLTKPNPIPSGGKKIDVADPDGGTGFPGKWEWKDGKYGTQLDITVSGNTATVKYSILHNGAVQDTVTFNGVVSGNQIVLNTPEGQMTLELEDGKTLRLTHVGDSIFLTRVGGGKPQPNPTSHGTIEGVWKWSKGNPGDSNYIEVIYDIKIDNGELIIKGKETQNGKVKTKDFKGAITEVACFILDKNGDYFFRMDLSEDRNSFIGTRLDNPDKPFKFVRVNGSSGGQTPNPNPSSGEPAPDKQVQITVTSGAAKDTTMAFNGVAGVTVSFKATNAIGYRLYRQKLPNGERMSVTDFYITATDFTDVNVEPSTQYKYQLVEILAEAKPLENIREKEGRILAEWTTKTSDQIGAGTENPTGKRHFIMLTIDDPMMSVDGELREVDPGRGTTPRITKSRTMVPIRAIVEAMDGNAGWNASSREVQLNANGNKVNMWIDKKDLRKNDQPKEMDIAPFIHNDRTYVPIRFSAENLKCQVDWINSTKGIVIVWSE